MSLNKTYQPQNIETSCYQTWLNEGYFSPTQEAATSFCIMLPPPNVTGYLHMGHGFQQTLMDVLIRYHRMLGDNTLWQGGCDHAGIATQMVVERQLQQQGISRHDLGREAFIEKIWEWKHTSGNAISQQIQRLGASIDWSRDRFTMDEGLSQAVNDVFIQLYDEGLIYRGQRLVNWDPTLGTAISDLEVLSVEEEGHLWHIRYPVANSHESLVVATTRPETMLGDTAVAVHPEDTRYQHLIGQFIHLPLSDRTIPIIADSYVDPAFGSGCVKITPAHDMNDYQMGQRHQLPLINIFTPKAAINDNAPARFQGLDRFEARKRILDELQQLGLLIKTEQHTLKIPRGDRSGTVIEPYLTYQWYVSMKPLAEPAIQAVRDGRIQFVPENWDKTYYQWLENIEDWCISRQLQWGHRIPAWYDEQGNHYVGEHETAVRAKYAIADNISLTQDEDVLDTWFSSALWPFSTLGWPEQTIDLARFYPTNVLVTGFDIIFFWVARMIMMALKFTGNIPFKTVYVHGLIRDAEGQKMSKSKGNVLDPIDLIDGIDLNSLVAKRTQSMMQPQLAQKIAQQTRKDFPQGLAASGCDALRFTFCALASNTRNIRFDVQRLEGYRHFCNKLWNAARFVLMNTENITFTNNQPNATYFADQWIMTRLQQVITQTHEQLEQFRFDYLAQGLYEFVWNDYCDWYLEFSKPLLWAKDIPDNEKINTLHTLLSVLDAILRLLHPIIPFITETIWQEIKPKLGLISKSIMLAAYPQAKPMDTAILDEMTWLQQVIVGIRTIRAEMNIAPSKAVPVYFHRGSNVDKQHVDKHQRALISLSKLSEIHWLSDDQTLPVASAALVGSLEILIPLDGLIDQQAELDRLTKTLNNIEKDIALLTNKLANEHFVAKAPTEVVSKEKARLAQLQENQAKLLQQKTALSLGKANI